jgi:hypothetical protein
MREALLGSVGQRDAEVAVAKFPDLPAQRREAAQSVEL